jgi:hypothetical protein
MSSSNVTGPVSSTAPFHQCKLDGGFIGLRRHLPRTPRNRRYDLCVKVFWLVGQFRVGPDSCEGKTVCRHGAAVVSGHAELFEWLAGDVGDDLEFLVHVQDREVNPGCPPGSIRARAQAYQCRLVDQPGRHRQARAMIPGSARSPKSSANRWRSETLTLEVPAAS